MSELNPPELSFDCQIFGLAFHPTTHVLAAGLISGQVELYELANTENRRLHAKMQHTESCRTVEFHSSGQFLVSGSMDKSIQALDLNTLNVVQNFQDAHESGVNVLKFYDENMLLSGDDDGVIKCWDIRTSKAVAEFNEHEDFISDFAIRADKNTLCVTSGDGKLSTYSLKRMRMQAVSDNMEDELLSLAIVKNGSKVLVGTQEGVLDIFSWGDWGDCSDRFPGHPSSVESMVVVDEDTVCTASSDGIIRIVSVHPNKMLGIVGEHGEFPIEGLSLSHDKTLLASCSHDQTVHIWNVAYLFEDDDEEDDEEAGAMETEAADADSDDSDAPSTVSKARKKKERKGKGLKESVASDFYSDL